MRAFLVFCCGVGATTLALAQAPAGPQEFPADATPLSGEVLAARFAGKVFKVAHANGSTWRLQYNSNGFYFVNIYPSGFSDSGNWRIEGGKICTVPQRSAASCNEVRAAVDVLYVKREASGEVIKLEPQ
jgi:hypothetical protein